TWKGQRATRSGRDRPACRCSVMLPQGTHMRPCTRSCPVVLPLVVAALSRWRGTFGLATPFLRTGPRSAHGVRSVVIRVGTLFRQEAVEWCTRRARAWATPSMLAIGLLTLVTTSALLVTVALVDEVRDSEALLVELHGE